MLSINTTREIVFDTLAEALASGRVFGNGELARIKGDHTRYKMGTGTRYSGLTPSTKTGKTFNNLPWIHLPADITNAVAVNVTGAVTAANLAKKYLTSTSAAAVSATLPTAALLAAALGAAKGYIFDFAVDNLAGANAVTAVVNTGIVAATPAVTGGASLVVAAGSIGYFRIVFSSATAALIFRQV